MKNLIYLIFILSGISAKADSWTQMTNFPGLNIVGCFSFVINSSGYIGCGEYATGFESRAFWEFNPSSNAWTQKADFGGTERRFAIGFSIAGKGYAGFGETQGSARYNDLWEYDPALNSWTQKTNSPMYVRTNAVGFAIADLGYVGTGMGTSSGNWPNNDFWAYDPVTDSWTQKASLPGYPRTNATGCSSGTKGYIGTGADSLSNPLRDWWEYDSVTDTWTQKADFQGAPRADAGCMSICGKIYLGTGDSTTSLTTLDLLKDFWQYDPVTDQWIRKTDYGGNKTDEVVFFSIANRGYVGLGSDTRANYDLWEYTPDSVSDCELTGIDKYNSNLIEYKVSLQPGNQLIIHFTRPIQKEVLSVEIFSLSGELIISSQPEIMHDQQKIMDIGTLAKGIYLIKVRLGQSSSVEKFVKV